ncbi:bifunctional (p)ppGpp synthetase/guanosine-3',5'-bis(diphosphate) 3'-pyrophosphohydrolase [Erysipelotrichaceae bacterium OH741_COT-311]|nr:bifunctional (p)ppGpp synthetase/guanosine-3',5'-bis(diphosphate) 3'-pyrophosphohydrolase [Erysipelotrichaceae bacterium OH741_COT-311]
MVKFLEVTHDVLFESIKSYITNQDSLDLIEKAYNYAQEHHEGQFRKNQEPYFTHLCQVAYILSQLHVGPKTIAAGLLHDVIEDCDVSKEQLTSDFDEEIATLVEAVTKIGNLKFKDEKEYQAANHRKIFIAMAKDIRVILIKLVDRLHNMRTLQYMKEEKQIKIAQETLNVYAPIAHRLGISEIKNELEDLSFFYLNRDEYYHIARLVEAKKNERDIQVNSMIYEISNILKTNHIPFRIFGRSKHLYSIYKKMTTKNKRFEEILDLLAIRIITKTELNCYEVLGFIHATYRPIPGRLKDYIAMPKMNMYQSLHTTIVGENGRIFEVQIRTEEMDQIADQGVAAHWRYKENTNYNPRNEQREIENKLSWFKDLETLTEDLDNDSPSAYMDTLTKDVFEANVYVMTPKGRVIDLPNGATPIDFAYRVHTEIGHQTTGAIVNESLVPLNTVLKTGDVVQLRTTKNSEPSADWLKFVKTNHAKNKIKNFLAKKETERRQDIIKQGEVTLSAELKKRGFEPSEYMVSGKLEGIYGQFQVSNYNDFMYAIAVKSISLITAVEKITNTKKSLFDSTTLTNIINSKEHKRKIPSKTGIMVKGVDTMKISLASCCNPIYGEEIKGYISKGQGVKVHRVDCPNIEKERKRLIDVYWDSQREARKYEANINIVSRDRNFLLTDIVTVISQYKGSLQSINSVVNNENLTVITKFAVLVDDIDHLNNIIANLKKVDGVITIDRVIK